MKDMQIPAWLYALNEQEINFIKNFVLHSGSLKVMAEIYELSYPTLRLRLNELIAKVSRAEAEEKEEFFDLLKELTFEDKLDSASAKKLLQIYERDRKK